jgi:hypothetical protein
VPHVQAHMPNFVNFMSFPNITSQIDKLSSATFFKRKGDQSILSTRKLGELFRLHRVC